MLLPRHNCTMHRKEAEKSPIETMEAFFVSLLLCKCHRTHAVSDPLTVLWRNTILVIYGICTKIIKIPEMIYLDILSQPYSLRIRDMLHDVFISL